MPVHDWTRVSAGTFHDFHSAWIIHIKEALNDGVLPPGYYAMAEQHAGGSIADILTLQVDQPAPPPFSAESNGGVAVVEAPARVGRHIVAKGLRRTLAVRRANDHRLVALIEIISPGNKDRATSIATFVQKAHDALGAGCHLLLVDLLPATPQMQGTFHEAIWEAYRELESEDDFTVPKNSLLMASYVAGKLPEAYVVPMAVGDKLLEMPLFLDPGWYVDVPLEATYQVAYRGMPEVWRNVLDAK